MMDWDHNGKNDPVDRGLDYMLGTAGSGQAGRSGSFWKWLVVGLLVLVTVSLMFETCGTDSPKSGGSGTVRTTTVRAAAPPTTTRSTTRAVTTTKRATKRVTTTRGTDPYDAGDYADPDDFYYDHYDDFYDYEDAEDYWDEWN